MKNYYRIANFCTRKNNLLFSIVFLCLAFSSQGQAIVDELPDWENSLPYNYKTPLIIDENVIKLWGDEYDTELKLAVFKKSKEYEMLVDSTKKVKNTC
jgi:hypothetical protein